MKQNVEKYERIWKYIKGSTRKYKRIVKKYERNTEKKEKVQKNMKDQMFSDRESNNFQLAIHQYSSSQPRNRIKT